MLTIGNTVPRLAHGGEQKNEEEEKGEEEKK